MAQSIELVQRRGVRRAPLSRAFHVLRTWPILPLVVLTGLVVSAVFAPVLAPQDPIKQNLRARNAPPFWYSQWYEEHPRVTTTYLAGADHVGRDVLSRVLYGARISMTVAAIALVTGTIVGTALGLVAGYFGGILDEFIMRLVDVFNSIPFLLIALVVIAVTGPGFGILLGLLALLAWNAFVRNVRAEVLSLKERDYVALAKVCGASNLRIMLKHIFPGVVNTVVVIATLRVGQLILAEASLSFLGVGIPKPTAAWGSMVADGRHYLSDAWWIALFPGLAIFLVVMSLNFLGDWLRDRFDPRLRQL